MTGLFTAENLISLVTLTAMEIVLGIDNIVFLAILSERLPAHQQRKARRLGLSLALIMRLALLFTLSTIMRLVEPLFTVFGNAFSGRDLVLLGGGLFLIGKAAHEIYNKVEGPEGEEAGPTGGGGTASFGGTLFQILALDIVFSLDSVITAVGMAGQIWVMVVAMIVAVGVMLVAADGISNFINRHPSMKMLALSFLLLIGVVLVADGLGKHIEKGYIYFAMGFAFLVELVNIRAGRKRRQGPPVVLHERVEGPTAPDRNKT
jgi:predicted tellurium resistance membrane protein TerC